MWQRRWFLVVVGAVALFLALAGCDSPLNQRGAGSLQLSIDTSGHQARSIGPTVSVDVNHYVIRGASDSGGSFEQTSSDTQLVVDGLAAGYWDVTVDAYNEGEVHLYTGSRRVLVDSGVALPVVIPLVAVPGTGTLSVTTSWPSGELKSPVVESSLIPTEGESEPLDFTVDGDAASFSSDEIASGYHTLVIQLKEGDMLVAGAVELVQMVSGQTTAPDFAFTDINAPGSLQIGVEVIPDFSESLIVTIDGGEVTSEYGVPVTLTGEAGEEATNVVFTWYVNGMAVDYGTAQTVISGDVPGYYRVDLIGVTADGADGGMATTWVRISEPGV
ncbi:MAG: hypothetical protein ACOC2Q_00410 [Spirochaetota bacterium]